MLTFDHAETARRSGIDADQLARMVDLGIVRPDADGRFTSGDLRRVVLVHSLDAAGIPLDGLGAAVRDGQVSLGFLDAPAFDRFAGLSDVTFGEMAARTGVPVELLAFVREAGGSVAVGPDDLVREDELPYVAMVESQHRAGFRPEATRRFIRAQGESMRRLSETEAAMWQSEVIGPATERGMRMDEILGDEFGDQMSVLVDRSLIAMYHMQQTKAWTAGLIGGVEGMLAASGLHARLERPPAMCFLDITGYTRLTQERGDAAAAELAEELGGIVGRESVRFGGRAVKWLGDGVMLHFPKPGAGVVAALAMVEGVATAGLPPAHVGLHAGPVIFQEGDYYGQTVNVASRIADYARPGEVVVSQAVVDASDGVEIVFREIGPVELKGVAGALHLHAAGLPTG